MRCSESEGVQTASFRANVGCADTSVWTMQIRRRGEKHKRVEVVSVLLVRERSAAFWQGCIGPMSPIEDFYTGRLDVGRPEIDLGFRMVHFATFDERRYTVNQSIDRLDSGNMSGTPTLCPLNENSDINPQSKKKRFPVQVYQSISRLLQ